MEFEKLHEDYSYFFDDKKNYEQVFFIALDAEWHQVDSNKNKVLSYQMAISSSTQTKNIIKYVKKGNRYSLKEIIKIGLEAVIDLSKLQAKDVLIILISHNFSAEWSSLADRDESYILQNLMIIRKSPVTFNHPIKLTIDQNFTSFIHIYDTMLLAPASHMSLKKLSVLLGSKELEKEEITQYYIENMHKYLEEYPDKFEKYALQDSKITLMLFFLLQDALNKLVYGGYKSLFKTLASAGVKSFKIKIPEFKKYKKELRRIGLSPKNDGAGNGS